MAKLELSETDRVRQQTNEEWLAEYEGTASLDESVSPQIRYLQPKTENNNKNPFLESVKNAGIMNVKHVGTDLLITTDRLITAELDNRIKQAIPRLSEIAEPDTGETLYVYVEHRTLFSNRKPYLALSFKEIHTGAIADRYFNISLQNKNDKSFTTGANCEFRIKGNIKRPMKGSFIKFWMDTVKEIPYGKPSHI